MSRIVKRFVEIIVKRIYLTIQVVDAAEIQPMKTECDRAKQREMDRVY